MTLTAMVFVIRLGSDADPQLGHQGSVALMWLEFHPPGPRERILKCCLAFSGLAKLTSGIQPYSDLLP